MLQGVAEMLLDVETFITVIASDVDVGLRYDNPTYEFNCTHIIS